MSVKNLTVTVEEDVLHWAKVWAARHNTSVSRLVGSLLRGRMGEDSAYDSAMTAYLSVEPQVLKESGGYPSREDLYDR